MNQENLISKNYYLVSPRTLEVRKETVDLVAINEGECVIKPLQFGICGSDLKYFLGHKSPKKLAKRLPLILGHEGVAQIVFSHSSNFSEGENVGVIPFLTCGECSACKAGRENYCSQAGYMASTAPGLAQQYMVYPCHLLRKIPQGVNLDAATLVEPMTIAYRAYQDIGGVCTSDHVVILGTGAIGYLVTVMVSHFGKVPRERLFYIGIEDEKLALAEDFATGINSRTDKGKQHLDDLRDQLDVAFECLGGPLAQTHSLPLLSSVLRSGGKLGIVGLEDAPVSFELNGQKVEIDHLTNFVNNGKEIKLSDETLIRGLSRSKLADYADMIAMVQNEDAHSKYLARLVHPRSFVLNDPQDLVDAFDFVAEGQFTRRVMVKMP